MRDEVDEEDGVPRPSGYGAWDLGSPRVPDVADWIRQIRFLDIGGNVSRKTLVCGCF